MTRRERARENRPDNARIRLDADQAHRAPELCVGCFGCHHRLTGTCERCGGLFGESEIECGEFTEVFGDPDGHSYQRGRDAVEAGRRPSILRVFRRVSRMKLRLDQWGECRSTLVG